MKIFLGADHRGYELKNKALKWLKSLDYNPLDQGAFEHNSEDDYTLYAEKVAVLVADNPRSRGILFCGSGVGVNVVANKIDGIRASLGKSVKQVVAGRKDDDMNVLIIAADFTTLKATKDMIKAFLKTKYVAKPRHKRRLEDIKRIEANN